jgi:hypothetical protein
MSRKLVSILPKKKQTVFLRINDEGRFEVVPQADADMVKVLYPDGRVEFGEDAKAAELHYGPGPHPSGSPQSSHGGDDAAPDVNEAKKYIAAIEARPDTVRNPFDPQVIAFLTPEGDDVKANVELQDRTRIEGRPSVYMNIFVPEHNRGQGYGTEVIKDLQKESDKSGVILFGSVKPFGRGDKMTEEQLASWYESLGFEVEGGDAYYYPKEVLRIGRKKITVDFHYGPARHPSGSPQSVHGNRGDRPGKRLPDNVIRERIIKHHIFPDNDDPHPWKAEDAKKVSEATSDVLAHGLATGNEKLYVYSVLGTELYKREGDDKSVPVEFDTKEEVTQYINISNVMVHNHPSSNPFSPDDIAHFAEIRARHSIVIGHDGDIHILSKTKNFDDFMQPIPRDERGEMMTDILNEMRAEVGQKKFHELYYEKGMKVSEATKEATIYEFENHLTRKSGLVYTHYRYGVEYGGSYER